MNQRFTFSHTLHTALKIFDGSSAEGIPARQQQKGILGMPEFQATYCSGGMTLFFENVARGKLLPFPEDESRYSTYKYVYVYMCVCLYAFMYTYNIYICVYIYIYVYVYIYVYIYIYLKLLPIYVYI